MNRKTVRIFILFTLVALGAITNNSFSQKKSSAGIFLIDSIDVGKTTLGIYGICNPVGVETLAFAFVDGVIRGADTITTTGTVPFKIRINNLTPGTDYNVRLVFWNFYGSDTISLGRITTISGLNQNNATFKIRNTFLTRAAGSTKVELRGVITMPPYDTAFAFCAIYSDSVCKKMIGNMSTKLNYKNPYNFDYMFDLYYNFNVDTNTHSVFYGKFWGSDITGTTSSDTLAVRVMIMPKKSTTGISELFLVDSFSIYPNPTSDYLFIPSSRYVITDMLGQIIRIDNGDIVDVRDLPRGLYLIEINRNYYRFTKI